MRVRVANVLVVVVGAACGVQSNVTPCEEDRVCPEATVCDEVHGLCVLPAQIEQCREQPDRTKCDVVGRLGTCQGGVCLEATCGTGFADLRREDASCDPVTGACADPYEVCDDGNNVDGDGCSGNCLSNETCGNTVVDPTNDELCDDGNLLDHDGCSSTCRTETVRWVQVMPSPGPLTHARGAYDAARDRVVIVGGRIQTGTNPDIFQNLGTVSEWDGMWHRNVPTGTFTPRDEPDDASAGATFGLAYDHERKLTVLTGGMVIQMGTRDVLGWDGVSWTRLPSLPYAVGEHAMAYDARRKRLVIFGGHLVRYNTVDVYNKTLELVGDTWTEVTTADRPSPRYSAEMTYDAKRGVIVLYGGTNGAGELWEYDGTNWSLRVGTNTATHPSLPRPTVAFDAATGKTVIYGYDTATSAQVMMTWDGNTLTNVPAGQLPQALDFQGAAPSFRTAATLVPDGTGRLMLYGGQNQFGFGGRPHSGRLLWFYEEGTWVEADRDPPPAIASSIIAQPERGSVLHFGGNTDGTVATSMSDTYQIGRRGSERYTTAVVPALSHATMVYDSVQHVALLFGGITAANVLSRNLYQWMDPVWVQVPVAGSWPGFRYFHAFVFDSTRGQAVLFGGNSTGGLLDDTWTWNGTSWTSHAPAQKPPARYSAALGHDPIAGLTVLFGGDSDTATNAGLLQDMWAWDGTNWLPITNTMSLSPPARAGGTLTWNPARQRLVLTQRFTPFPTAFDAWEWTFTSTSPPAGHWTELVPATSPQHRITSSTFPTLDGSGITIAYGDVGDAYTFVPSNDYWELRFDGPDPSDACVTSFDVDGDTRVACEDEDCWRSCTPSCPPSTSCPIGSLQCGDSTCAPTENCHNCPADCSCTGDTWCGDFVCDPGEQCLGDCP